MRPWLWCPCHARKCLSTWPVSELFPRARLIPFQFLENPSSHTANEFAKKKDVFLRSLCPVLAPVPADGVSLIGRTCIPCPVRCARTNMRLARCYWSKFRGAEGRLTCARPGVDFHLLSSSAMAESCNTLFVFGFQHILMPVQRKDRTRSIYPRVTISRGVSAECPEVLVSLSYYHIFDVMTLDLSATWLPNNILIGVPLKPFAVLWYCNSTMVLISAEYFTHNIRSAWFGLYISLVRVIHHCYRHRRLHFRHCLGWMSVYQTWDKAKEIKFILLFRSWLVADEGLPRYRASKLAGSCSGYEASHSF